MGARYRGVGLALPQTNDMIEKTLRAIGQIELKKGIHEKWGA
jgi:hypothetical protein